MSAETISSLALGISFLACIAAWWKASTQSRLLNETLKEWQRARKREYQEKATQIEALDAIMDFVNGNLHGIDVDHPGDQAWVITPDRREELDALIERLPNSLAVKVMRICHDLGPRQLARERAKEPNEKALSELNDLRGRQFAAAEELK